MKKMICLLMAVLMLTGAAVAETGNQLGFDVLRELSDGTGNQIVSPLSLAYAMAMAAEGAQGDTRSEMLAALEAEDVSDVSALLAMLETAGLKQANAAFLPGVFDGFAPVGHQGVAYGMCSELFADPERDCGVGVMINGVRLVKAPPLMRAGFDLLALGFAAAGSLQGG